MNPERSEDMDVPYPHYRCPACGQELPLTEAKISVTCGEHEPERTLQFTIREAGVKDRRAIEEICDRAWGETDVDTFGKTYDVLSQVNLLAEADGEFAGLLSLAVDGGDLVIVLLSVYPEFQGSGIGSALVRAAVDYAAGRNLPLVRVAVTNDDIPSLYFYQRQGFTIYDVAVGLVADSLGSAPAGFSSIPIRDEIRLRRPVARP